MTQVWCHGAPNDFGLSRLGLKTTATFADGGNVRNCNAASEPQNPKEPRGTPRNPRFYFDSSALLSSLTFLSNVNSVSAFSHCLSSASSCSFAPAVLPFLIRTSASFQRAPVMTVL